MKNKIISKLKFTRCFLIKIKFAVLTEVESYPWAISKYY